VEAWTDRSQCVPVGKVESVLSSQILDFQSMKVLELGCAS
jgi:hypothetical protein